MYSDRRGRSLIDAERYRLELTHFLGGRTAWSSRVTIDGHSMSARYWYDGKYLNNAKEDVAEVAYNWLISTS